MTRKLPEVMKEEEVLKLFQYTFTPHHKLVMMFMYYCGLRVSEAINLSTDDIDLKDSTLMVKSGKGGKDRLVPIPKPMMQAYKDFIKLYKPEGKIFTFGKRSVHYMVKRQGAKIGKPTIHPHTLRHSYATHILKKTNNLKLVKDLLGHESIATTQIYTHLDTTTKQANIKKIWG